MEYFAYSQKDFVYKYVVMLSDTDQFQHMSFANYLKLMFLAADALFVSCFNESFLSERRMKLKTSRMQFKKQTIAGEKILIKINASDIKEFSFSLLFTFVVEGTGELVGLGKQKYEIVERKTNVARALSDDFRNLLVPIDVEEENLLYKY